MDDFLNKELAKINEGLAKEEAIKKEADSLMMNKIKKYEDEISRLKDDRDRLVEENHNFEVINKSHKELNGEIRKELNEVKADNKKLAKQIEDIQQNYIRIDGKK
jgi:septal ring factor EnvC (AmiA/AmiB activator)